MATILDEIVANKRVDLETAKQRMRIEDLEAMAAAQEPPLDLAAALQAPGLRVIAEVKRASPSKGALNLEADPVQLATVYASNGAAAISVLTEERYFKGSLADLESVKSALRRINQRVPVLRKDFIVDDYQVYEARAYGADALLLIAASLATSEMARLLALSRQLGMECLVEVHDDEQLHSAIEAGASIIGVNNRDLRTFKVDIETTRRLLPGLPPRAIAVSESGILGRAEVETVMSWGIRAILVGEALMTSGDPAGKLRELLCSA